MNEDKDDGGWTELNIAPAKKMPIFCLNMIVKDEAHIIEKCLTSVIGLIDTYRIVDTGSSDGTQHVIRAFMESHEIKGEIFDYPWMEFGPSRTMALKECMGVGVDYALFMDADDYLINEQYPGEPIRKHQLTDVVQDTDKEVYLLRTHMDGSVYVRPFLCRPDMGWHWKGVRHEGLYPPQDRLKSHAHGGILNVTFHTETAFEGNRSRVGLPAKYASDAAVMVNEFSRRRSARELYYIAQSLKDAYHFKLAAVMYTARGLLPDSDADQRYMALHMAASIYEEKLAQPDKAADLWMHADQIRPARHEAAYSLAASLSKRGLSSAAKLWITAALAKPSDVPDSYCYDRTMRNQLIPELAQKLLGI